MHNPKKTVSASEINKFIYCNYQWYYERLYGGKALREMYGERNARLNLTDSAQSNFARGLEFHSRYGARRRAAILKTLLLIMAVVGIYVLWYFFRRMR